MSEGKDFEMAWCGCCDKPGLCLKVTFCPCFAFCEGAENIGSENGLFYCLATYPLGFGCCVLSQLGMDVTKKAGIEMTCTKSVCLACFDPCCCYSCRVINQSRLLKDSPEMEAMNR
eukprot:CAMPEP_0116840292 /NCGR_PEP_ID=MMETSP0418-20121206/10265_1 /TAXON_ID=1158023 /ORGANISM="Astrosyne radiata, Strain 13vi08-1A" /LENGTH=115 /DNA_ID=CAMNT_0004470545 /DNA_START=35 /DNA_END=382 /DNA_ORIENTATION=+